MDPCSSPYILPNSSLQNPFLHSLLRNRQKFDVRRDADHHGSLARISELGGALRAGVQGLGDLGASGDLGA